MDIELVNTEDKPITGIRKRCISNDIQKTNPDFKTMVNFFMKADKGSFLDNKLLLVHFMNDVIERAFIEGQRTGKTKIEYIKGEDNGIRKEDVYKNRSDNYVGD